jgi:hypothetical protein
MNPIARRPAVFAAALFVAAASPMSHANDERPESQAAVGSRVRVTAASPAFTGSVTGTLVKVGPDTLMIVDPRGGVVTELPFDSVQRLEVSRRGSRARRGLLIGAALGALAAIAVYGDETFTCNTSNEPARVCGSSERFAYSAFAVGFYGGIGAWIGNRRKTDTWSDAPIGSVRLSLRPAKGGARAGLTLTF